MDTWRRPTEIECQRGFVAMLQHVAYIDGRRITYDSNGKTMWFGYTRKMMNRRIARAGDLPYWITPIEPAVAHPEYVAIVGSRNFPNEQQVRHYVQSLSRNTIVVSGGASGVDGWAASEARKRDLLVIEYHVDENRITELRRNNSKLGNRAAYAIAANERNTLIINKADRVVAFWDGKSKGTLDSINKAKAQGKPIEVIQPLKPNLNDIDAWLLAG